MSKLQRLVLNHKNGTSEFIIKDENAPAFDEVQNKTEKEKAQARKNIGAAAEGEVCGGSVLYASLSAAIADLNNGTTANAVTDRNSPVEVFTAENGEKIVRLLADVSESTQIDITADMTLVLNGYTLNLTTAEAYLNFAEGTNCTINGEVEGSAIKKENITTTGSCYVINTSGKATKVIGGYYSVSGNLSKASIIFRATALCNRLEIDGVEALAENSQTTIAVVDKCIQSQASFTAVRNSTLTAAALKALCIHIVAQSGNAVICDCKATGNSLLTANTMSAAGCLNSATSCEVINSTFEAAAYTVEAVLVKSGKLTIKHSSVFADALSGHAGQSSAIGIINQATLTCIDTDVIGTHSAIESYGDLFVKGGTFSGYAHGGFYLTHGAENKAYINNAVMRFGVYEGSFADFEAVAYAGFYIGLDSLDSPGISVYMDGCTIEGQGGEVGVVRAGAVGTTNTLYISNTVNNSTSQSIRLNKDQTTNRAEMKIGMGCNFTTANASDPQWAEETGKLYRRMKDDMPMDGRDFNALNAFLQAQNV